MKRRDSFKTIVLSTFGIGVAATSANAENMPSTEVVRKKDPDKPGSTDEEKLRDRKLKADIFFTKSELVSLTVLVDIILPADSLSGSASQAGVPAFIEFMAKDRPELQTPLRGGLKWLDIQCLKRFGQKFVDCSSNQRIEIVDLIAYPKKALPEYSQGVKFFSLARNLTVTGFYTTEMGFNDLDYRGNTPNNWEGVPDDVLKKYGLSY
jgi:gluconate 2-dehydrogenase gamma chain